MATPELAAQLAVVGSSACAMALGGVIGYEREMKNRPAGFRTHMLVAGAAALVVGIGRVAMADPLLDAEDVQVDPLRLVEAVIAGVAFIGAGTIFGRRGQGARVQGITTAATLLMVAVIGIASGFRYYWLAVAATVLTMVVLTLVNVLERHAQVRRHARGGDADGDAPDARDDS